MGSTKTYKKIPELNENDYVRFWSKATLTADIGKCWNWNSTIRDKDKPYGRFSKGRNIEISAHRVAYFLYYKEDPKELHVLHNCDNPRCVNPHHLFLGTNNDNVQDKVLKGRQAKGGGWKMPKESIKTLWDNHVCNCTKEDFDSFIDLYVNKKWSINRIEKEYGVAKRTVAAWIRSHGIEVPKIFTVLKNEDVLYIRENYSFVNRNHIVLSKKFNVGVKTIMDIVQYKTWKNI